MIDCAPAPAPLARRSHRTLSSIRTASIRTASIAQRPVIHRRRRFLLLLRRRSSADSCCRETVSGQSPSSAALGIAGGSVATDELASASERGTRRLCRPTASRSAARDRSAAEGPQDRCCQVPLCPFPLLPSISLFHGWSVSESLEHQGKRPVHPGPVHPHLIRAAGVRVTTFALVIAPCGRTAFLPSVATPYGCLFCSISSPLRGTSRYPYGSSHEASATPGAARSSHHRSVLPQAPQPWREAVLPPRDLVASGCGDPCRNSTAR